MPMLANLLFVTYNILYLIKVLKFVLKFGAIMQFDVGNWLVIFVKYFRHWIRKIGDCSDVELYEFAVGVW